MTPGTPLAEAYLLVAMYVAVPLAARFLGVSRRGIVAIVAGAGLYHAGLSFGLPWLAIPWLLVTVGLAGRGARRLVGRGLRDWAECSIDAGALMLPIGAAWSFAWLAGLEPIGTRGIWVLLTAVHFHWAAFVLPIVVGGFGRLAKLPGPYVATAIVCAIPMTAVGIAFSDAIELVAALTLAGSAFVFALTMLQRPVFLVPALSLAAAMTLAATFALQAGPVVLPIEQMVAWHGTANALGFGLLSLLALNWLRPESTAEVEVPFSKIFGELRLGADFFTRSDLEVDGAARGLVDRLNELDGPDFDASRVDDSIRDFYENTIDYDLHVVPHWKWWSAWAGAIWYQLARRMQQTVFPPATGESHDIGSRVFPLDAHRDGRDSPRAWVRTFPDGRSMYVAAYSMHRRNGRAYMNIAFPFWRSNMASILFPTNLGESGLRLDTLTAPATPDAGIWQVTPLGPIRLPLREFIDVWNDDGTMRATHELRVFGLTYLTLDYVMSLRP